MSKERLEEIKKKYFMYENYTGKVIMYHHVLEWLIEQAERVQELESRIADDEHFVVEILEQNKRYREALEFYAKEYGADRAIRALEGEE